LGCWHVARWGRGVESWGRDKGAGRCTGWDKGSLQPSSMVQAEGGLGATGGTNGVWEGVKALLIKEEGRGWQGNQMQQ